MESDLFLQRENLGRSFLHMFMSWAQQSLCSWSQGTATLWLDDCPDVDIWETISTEWGPVKSWIFLCFGIFLVQQKKTEGGFLNICCHMRLLKFVVSVCDNEKCPYFYTFQLYFATNFTWILVNVFFIILMTLLYRYKNSFLLVYCLDCVYVSVHDLSHRYITCVMGYPDSFHLWLFQILDFTVNFFEAAGHNWCCVQLCPSVIFVY